jgi:hypothetical protein
MPEMILGVNVVVSIASRHRRLTMLDAGTRLIKGYAECPKPRKLTDFAGFQGNFRNNPGAVPETESGSESRSIPF